MKTDRSTKFDAGTYRLIVNQISAQNKLSVIKTNPITTDRPMNIFTLVKEFVKSGVTIGSDFNDIIRVEKVK
jgi:hypothetical protein